MEGVGGGEEKVEAAAGGVKALARAAEELGRALTTVEGFGREEEVRGRG